MSETLGRQEGEEAERFFSTNEPKKRTSIRSESFVSRGSGDDEKQGRCLTLRIIQKLLPCFKTKGVWDASQGDLLKGNDDAQEAKYPRILRVLESKILDAVFAASCFISINLFFFSEGFLKESRLLWGIIHMVNAIYALGLFSQWLQILIKSKYAKTNHGYTTMDILYTLASVFPVDLIILVIYSIDGSSESDEISNPISSESMEVYDWLIALSRVNYLMRIRSILLFFSKWENQLVIGDFGMFILRNTLFSSFLFHMLACFWHRIACRPFQLKHFIMTPDEATTDVCEQNSWIGVLKLTHDHPLLDHPDWHVLLTHYLASFYWTVVTTFGLGAGDVHATLTCPGEIAFVTFSEILAWIYILVNVNGMLTSLFIEKDVEKEHYFVRCVAIRLYLRLSEVSKSVIEEVDRFYKYLWTKSKGILNVDLIDEMPLVMKSEVYYDVNKFMMDQMPMLKGLDTPFLMSLSLHTTHKFYLKGEILFRKHDTATSMYYLVKGFFEILGDDGLTPIATIRSGSIIGEIHLMQPYPHIASVRCGTDCDVLVLSRKDFRRVLAIYPQFVPVLEQRLETRLEQSGLLLALCEKHNLSHKAFRALREFQTMTEQSQSLQLRQSAMGGSFENVLNVLSKRAYGSNNVQRNADDDLDGLELSGAVVSKLNNKQNAATDESQNKTYDELAAYAYLALETDVARAGSLSTDLNIPRPPIIVVAPDHSTRMTIGFKKERSSVNVVVSYLKYLKIASKGKYDFMWKLYVSLWALVVFWYYPYQFAFGGNDLTPDYYFHIADVVFAIDWFYDMIQVVVTPQRTFEKFKEVLAYRLKTVYFYFRIISFLPIEYPFLPLLMKDNGTIMPYFYLLKCNRMFNIHLVNWFISSFEARYLLLPVFSKTFIRLSLGFFFGAHLCAVSYKFVRRYIIGKDTDTYLRSYYRAIVVTSGLGYGDIRSEHTSELVVEVLGLMIGISMLVCLQSKVMAFVVNQQRQRKYFHQTFYSLIGFMKQRKFPKALISRVSDYYNLQWNAHSGALIPKEKTTIWDAPTEMIAKVSISIGYKYISRIPLFMDARLKVQTKCCLALKHYMIPPGEIILYPNEKARDLYIISKGYIQVVHQGKKIGIFGEGRCFGMSGLLFGINTDFMFVTLTHCQVLCLSYNSFLSLIESNEQFRQEVLLLASPQETENINRPAYLNRAQYEELSYPTDEFMAEHVENSPPVEANPQDDPSYVPNRWVGFRKMFECNRGFYFLPHGYGLKCWTIFRVVTSAFSIVLTGAQLAFAFQPTFAFWMILSFDMIVWIDMFITSRTAYLGSQNQLITNSCSMLKNYLGGSFLIDLLSCLPIDHIVYLIYFQEPDFGNMHHVISFLRLNRLIQGTYVLMANRILGKTIVRSLTFIVVLEMIPLMFIFANLGVCFAVLPVCLYTKTGKIGECSNQDAWILNGLRHILYSTNVKGLYDTFVSYLVGIYWFTQTVFNYGFGDIPIGNDGTNQFIAITVIFTGTLMATYIGAKLTSCILGEDPAKLALQEKMVLINDFLDEHRVKRSTRRRVSEVFVNQWNQTGGVTPAVLFEALPPALKTDVMKQLYGSALEMSPLFENLDGPGLRILANSLTEVYYAEGEFIMKLGDLCDDIFFIAKGAVVCYNKRGDVMCQLGAGSLIGEVGPFFGSERLYTATALEDVCAFVIEREAFMTFLELYPDIRTILERCSIKHYKESTARKMGSVDNADVSMTIQNEIQKDTHKDDLKSVGTAKRAASVDNASDLRKLSAEEDMTRMPLRNRAQITAEELAKPTIEKWWHVFVTFGRLARDEMGFVHIVQEAGKCHFFNFSIHPASHVCGWVSFCLLMVAISCSITSYELAFSSRRYDWEYITLIVARCVVELFFVIRIIGNFHLAYYNEAMILITGVKQITKRYVRRVDGLWLDFVTTFPFYLCEYFLNVKGEYIRGLQLLRVILFVRYLRATDSRLKMNTRRVQVFKITVLLCFIFHFWACAWYLAACNDDLCTRGSWMHEVLINFRNIGKKNEDITTLERYLLSLFYVANTLTFTGFNDVTPGTKLELILSLCIVYGTVFLIGYLVGEMVQCLASQVATKIEYQHKLSVLETHFVTLGISASKIAEVRRYYKLLWCRCRGKIFFNLMQELPYTVRADVAMELYGSNVKSSRLLGKLDENLIRQICAKIRHEIYFPGSHIVRAGDVCTSMYFIKKGEVVILDGNSNIELCVEILYEHECFGEVKILLAREQFRFSYVARLESEVGVLHKSDLDDVLKNHPKIFEELKEKANKVKMRRQSMKELEGNDYTSAANVSLGTGANQTKV